MSLASLMTRFTSVNKIKKGGQKIVYKAIDATGKAVALKIINNAADPRALQEIEIVNNLKLKNVPVIIESGIVKDETIDEDVLYIIEEFIDGISLRDWLGAGNKADISFAYRLCKTLLEIEVQLEKEGILHRDINPNNIILGKNGIVYLIDFGIAKQLNGTSFTNTAALYGPFTPGYAPYEQVANIKSAQDARTDLFQIGITVDESCTGKNPFVQPADSVYQIVARTQTLVPPVLALENDKKGLFGSFINMLMAKNQSQRPDTAFDAMRYLNAISPTLKI